MARRNLLSRVSPLVTLAVMFALSVGLLIAWLLSVLLPAIGGMIPVMPLVPSPQVSPWPAESEATDPADDWGSPLLTVLSESKG